MDENKKDETIRDIPLPEGVTPEMEKRAQQMTAAVIGEWDNILTEVEALQRLGVMLQGSRYFGARNTDAILKAVSSHYRENGGDTTPQMTTAMILGTLIVSQQLDSEIAWLVSVAEAADRLSKRCRALSNEMNPMRTPDSFLKHLKACPSELQ